MLVPQQRDQFNQNIMTVDYLTRPNDLIQNLSPKLPMNFDKSYLPKNLCQRQYLKLSYCYLSYDKESQKQCSYQLNSFQQCRIERDSRIFDGIKKWQQKNVKSLDKNNQKLYIQGLTFKLDRLKQQYNKIPSTASKAIKMSQLQSQIQHTKWRMKYIKKLIQSTN